MGIIIWLHILQFNPLVFNTKGLNCQNLKPLLNWVSEDNLDIFACNFKDGFNLAINYLEWVLLYHSTRSNLKWVSIIKVNFWSKIGNFNLNYFFTSAIIIRLVII